MIADFAHEVRNPINNISTGLQLMRKKTQPDGTNIQIIDRMQSDCIRMSDLMESILSFSRKDFTDFKIFDCCDLLEKIHERFKNKYKKANITANFNRRIKQAMINGDMRSIDQVFTNLINNAIDAMSEDGGELSIRVSESLESNNFIEINISDTGRGIPDQIKQKCLSHLFQEKRKGLDWVWRSQKGLLMHMAGELGSNLIQVELFLLLIK